MATTYQEWQNAAAAYQAAKAAHDANPTPAAAKAMRQARQAFTSARDSYKGGQSGGDRRTASRSEAEWQSLIDAASARLEAAMSGGNAGAITAANQAKSELETQRALEYDPEFQGRIAALTPGQRTLLEALPLGQWREMVGGGGEGRGYFQAWKTDIRPGKGGSGELTRLGAMTTYYRQAIEAAEAAGNTALVAELREGQRVAVEARQREFYRTLTPDKIHLWAFSPFGVGPIPSPTGPLDQGGPGVSGADWAGMSEEEREQTLRGSSALALAAAMAAAVAGYEGVQEWREAWKAQPGGGSLPGSWDDPAWLDDFMPDAQAIVGGMDTEATAAELDEYLQGVISRGRQGAPIADATTPAAPAAQSSAPAAQSSAPAARTASTSLYQAWQDAAGAYTAAQAAHDANPTPATAKAMRQARDAFTAARDAYKAAGGAAGAAAAPTATAGTMVVGTTTLPEGGQLYRVATSIYSDEATYYLVYDLNGVRVSFEIGNLPEANRLLGTSFREQLGGFTSISQANFDALDTLSMGLVDEQMGATESMSAQVNRGLREARFEDIPIWMSQDMELMRIITIGTLEEWSAGRIWKELAGTSGFAARFPAFDQIRRTLGGGSATITETVTKYLQEEDTLRLALRRFRGRSTDTSVEYLGEILKFGWSATEAVEVLEAENLLRSNPEMLTNLNAILQASGMHALADTDMVDIMRGNAPTRVYEAINDTLRLSALKKAGLQVDPALVATFGEGVAESVASAAERGQYSTAAQQAALDLIQNWREVDLGKLGVGRDEIVQAAFGEGFAAETEAKLLKFQRERQAAGAGWGGSSAYQGDRGQLVLSGLKQL